MNPRREINSGELRRLYLDERLTIEQIAKHFACGATTIRRRLNELHIPTRAHGPRLDPNKSAARRAWSPQLAYAIGLIATDGNLSKDGRHISVVSADHDLLDTLRDCLRLTNRVTRSKNYFRVQWGDRQFYDWLLSIGLMPAKSLRLGALKIPDAYFADFVRGCLDGDGSISIYTDRHNTFKNEKYVYERLMVRFHSASFPFVEWLRSQLTRLFNLRGAICRKKSKLGNAPIWDLKFAKRESIALLNSLYYSRDVPCLARKRILAEPFLIE